MSIAMHTLKPAKGSKTRRLRIGRGNSSGHGTTAGKGTKGQRARTGGRNRLKLKGMKQMLLSFPKNRGFRSGYVKPEVVTLERLSQAFPKAEVISLTVLKKAGLVSRQALSAKIIGGGELKVALRLRKIGATKSAALAIEKAGGKIN